MKDTQSDLDRLKIQSRTQKLRLDEYSRQAPLVTATTWLSSTTPRASIPNFVP